MKYYHYGQMEEVALVTDGDSRCVATLPQLSAAGLRLYGQRLYDVDLGRFLMPDTIIPNLYEPQSHNPYSYCHNDPVNYVDPSGHYRRVPRIFPHGEMPGPGTNLLVGGLQIASAIVGTLVTFGLGGNFAVGLGAAMVFDIAVNALVPAILAKDRDTLTRTDILTRLVVDILTHSLVAAGGFFAQNLVVGRTRRKFIPRAISLLVVNSGTIVGGMWSSQLGGLMKSFGMGYNLSMAVHQSRVIRHRQQHQEYEDLPDMGQGASLDGPPQGWWGRLSQGAAAARDYAMHRFGGHRGDIEDGGEMTPLKRGDGFADATTTATTTTTGDDTQ